MQSEIRSMHHEIENIYNEEKEERFMRKAEMEIQKAENLQDHHDEIYSRPKREWFMSEKQKQKIQ
jgi:ATP-dependent RNA helicase DDX27